MCLIIRSKKEINIILELMKEWYASNDDGWGMMWIQDNVLQTHRSMEGIEILWDKYNEVKEYEPIIHLRQRTHGDHSVDNCHPFDCGFGIHLMHNGILQY